jgi:hypothetical protein
MEYARASGERVSRYGRGSARKSEAIAGREGGSITVARSTQRPAVMWRSVGPPLRRKGTSRFRLRTLRARGGNCHVV